MVNSFFSLLKKWITRYFIDISILTYVKVVSNFDCLVEVFQ